MKSEYFFELIEAACRNDLDKMVDVCIDAANDEWSKGHSEVAENLNHCAKVLRASIEQGKEIISTQD